MASSKKRREKVKGRGSVRNKKAALKKASQDLSSFFLPPKSSFFSFSLPPKSSFAGFALRFAFFFGIPYALLHVLPLGGFLDVIAFIESVGLHALGVASVVFGSFLSANSAWFQIVSDCSGLVMVSLLFGLLWSTPVAKTVRERFFLRWAPLLLVYNLVRLLVVLYVGGTLGMRAMDAVHLGLWLVDAALVLGIWWKAFSEGSDTK
ncbi:hypothetical protein HY994_05990 [Candidatus Micrarchaeota archaeon]|nr:hypothetical protein [Candidatus Micrarchaeota archaeon]